MKRGFIVLALCALAVAAYFTASKWAIKHTTLTIDDILREGRPVTFDVAVRRDREAGIKLVKTDFQHTEFSDRGADRVKAQVLSTLDRFLDEDEDGPSLSLLTASVPPPFASGAPRK